MLPLVSVGLLLASTLTVDKSIPDEPGADPLAPAQSGMVQCYEPDVASHSCRMIATYRHPRNGAWTKVVTILPDPAEPMTVDIESPVTLRSAQVCSTFQREQVMAAKLSYFGRLVPAEQATPFLSQTADAMAGAFGREICTNFVVVGGVLVARPTITGTVAKIPDQRVIWVRADAGFHVEPRKNQNG